LGKGSYGVVVKAVDLELQAEVAIKVIKNQPLFEKQAEIEIQISHALNYSDPHDEYHIARFFYYFRWNGHLCLVFELLSRSLYDLLRLTEFKGVSLKLVRKFAKQILQSLFYLGQLKFIHCDIKPENILQQDPDKGDIKLIDFGSSCTSGSKTYKYIQSRFYRAPEVLLELEYGCPIDMWSLGCTLVEMHTGEPLFAGRDETDQLAKISEVCGLPPDNMTRASPKIKKFFQQQGSGLKLRTNNVPISRDLLSILNVPRKSRIDTPGHTPSDYNNFFDLIKRMLCYDPRYRIAPTEALQHPFIVNTQS